MNLPQAARWKVAADKEVASLEKHGVNELVLITSVPNKRKIVGTRWVYNIKGDGVYKGRLVVLGWSHVPGIDCGKTFAPVRRLQSIQMVLVIAAELDYEVYTLDVQAAFLNADVEEEVFVKMAPGYERSNESGVVLVMKLKKSLYGLRQSPKNWFSTTMVSVCSSLSVRLGTCANAHVQHSTFLFRRENGLVVSSDIFVLFKFSVWTVPFLHAIRIEGEC